MLMSLALVAALSAPAAAPRVVTLDFKVVKVKKDDAMAWRQHLANKLGERGVEVVDTGTLPVKKKKLLACAHKTAKCVVELAKAMELDAVVVGEVVKQGQGLQVKVRVLAAANAKPLFVYAKLVRSEDDVVDALNTAAERAAPKLGAEAPPTPEPASEPVKPVAEAPKDQPKAEPAKTEPVVAAAPPPEPEVEDVLAPTPELSVRKKRHRGFKWQPWAVAGGGVVIAGIGAVFLAQSAGTWGNLTGTPTFSYTPTQAAADAQAAQGTRTLGLAVTGVGLAVAAAGITWIIMEPRWRWLTLVPTDDGFAFSFAGRW